MLLAQENQFMNEPIEYSAAMENTLIRSCLSGDSERTLEILDHIFQNTAEINATDLTQLIYSFRATILRVLTEVTGEDISIVASDSRHLTSCQNGGKN